MPRDVPPAANIRQGNKPRGKMDRSFLLQGGQAPARAVGAHPGQTIPATAGKGDRVAPNDDPSTIIVLPGVRTGVDTATGERFLHIAAKDAHGKALPPFVLDSWLRYEEIGLSFAEAVHGVASSTPRVLDTISALRPFFAWLDAQFKDQPPTHLSDLTSSVLRRYRAHLDGLKDNKGKPLSDTTKRIYLSRLRLPFRWMIKSAPTRWASKLAPGLHLPLNSWKSAKQRTTPRDIIPADNLSAIIRVAAQEVERTIERFEASSALILDGRRRLHPELQKRGEFRDIAIALAAVDDWYDGFLPNQEAALARHPGLASAILKIHGSNAFFGHLYPSPRDIVPFVILLTLHTAYNPDTILGLRTGHVVMNDLFPEQFGFDIQGQEHGRLDNPSSGELGGRVRLKPVKNRPKPKVQNRSFRTDVDDKFGVYLLLEAVKSITARIRPHAGAGHVDRVFLFHVFSGKGTVRSFGCGKQAVSGDTVWRTALNSFIGDNNLPPFSLVQIRSTVGDGVEQITGDIRAVQLLLCHTGTDVTFHHYLSAGARRRASENLGMVQGMRQRWIEAGGKRDSREPARGDTLMAATLGFHCLDPYDSPMPGQTPGKMCSAWLACAFCPLAAVPVHDGGALARLIQLEAHIRQAQATIPPERYRAVYVPLLSKLVEWLERFSPDARTAASAITYLKPLPELE